MIYNRYDLLEWTDQAVVDRILGRWLALIA